MLTYLKLLIILSKEILESCINYTNAAESGNYPQLQSPLDTISFRKKSFQIILLCSFLLLMRLETFHMFMGHLHLFFCEFPLNAFCTFFCRGSCFHLKDRYVLIKINSAICLTCAMNSFRVYH